MTVGRALPGRDEGGRNSLWKEELVEATLGHSRPVVEEVV